MQYLPYIDLYCERISPSFWNEPLNALSNAAFILAALWGLYSLKRRGNWHVIEVLLLVLAASIGIGSFLFHTIPNSWTELADTIPIWSFVFLYVLFAIYRSTSNNKMRTLRTGSIVTIVTAVIFWFSSKDVSTDATASVGPLNGSLQYLPAIIALGVFALLTQLRKHPARMFILAAALAFLVSLTFRTLDLSLCPSIPFGTHFLWHLFNGAMIAFLLQAIIWKFVTTKPVGKTVGLQA